MSIESWKKEFYPVPASEAANTTAQALDHSIRKWEGLRKKDLQKHGVKFKLGHVTEGDDPSSDLGFDAESCALCHKFHGIFGNCGACPLYKEVGVACGKTVTDPFSVAIDTGDIRPMLAALRRAKKKLAVVR